METKDYTFRSVGKIISSQQKQIGTLPVRTPTISRRSKEIDPFLQLDHKGPVHVHSEAEQETTEQPNKGFEILTYLLEGCMEYTDSQANCAVLYSGDVQLLTAGRGILHKESSQVSLSHNGKDIHAIDIWINLPTRKKLSEPAYQHISSYQLPIISLDNVMMKVLAGEWNGEFSPVLTGVPVLIMHLMLEAGAETEVTIPSSYQAALYVLKGCGLFGEQAIEAEEGKLVSFNNGGEVIRVKAPESKSLEVILLSGEPIGEAIVTYGPFVMNSIDEICEAMIEYSSGQMGSLTL